MGLDSRSIVYIVQVIFFVPALLASIFVAFKQGMGRNALWIYLVLLSILRIVGGGTGVASQYYPDSQGVVETSVICSTVGLSPLLMGWLSVLGRINDGMSAKRFNSTILLLLHLPVLAALALAIYGGTNLFDDDPSKVHDALTYTKAGVLIFVALLALIALINVYFLLHKRYTLLGEHKLIYAGILVTPFLMVRIIYSILADFNWGNSTIFSLSSDSHKAVVVEAIMFVLMEFIVVIIWLLAGFFTKPVPKELLTKRGRNSVVTQPEQQYK